jgi:hypothetical protein
MEIKKFPIASSNIRLDAKSFKLQVWVDGVVSYTINQGSGLVSVSTTDSELVLSMPGTATSLETTMLRDNIRSFEVTYNGGNSCREGGLGVQDIRDLRTTYWWCVSGCPIVVTLTEVEVEGMSDPQDALVIYRTSDDPQCYSKTTT